MKTIETKYTSTPQPKLEINTSKIIIELPKSLPAAKASNLTQQLITVAFKYSTTPTPVSGEVVDGFLTMHGQSQNGEPVSIQYAIKD